MCIVKALSRWSAVALIFLLVGILAACRSNPIPAPSTLEAQAGFHQVTLAWERVAAADSYHIYVAETERGTYSLAEANVTSTTHQVHFINEKPLAAGQPYYFKIKSSAAGKESSFSKAVSATPLAYNKPDGWAATGDGTIGGDNADDYVIVTSHEQFTDIVKQRADFFGDQSPPLKLYIKGYLAGNRDISFHNVHNVTIEGLGTDAIIDGYGFIFRNSKNIIVRNLTIQNSPNKGIDVQTSSHLYFEHNDFSNAGDGLTDVKSGSDFITFAWNKYENHEKTMIIGAGWSAKGTDRGKLNVTLHHNWFKGTEQRHPRVRFGQVHVVNNYYLDIVSYAVASTSEAQVLVEGNTFENVRIAAMYSRGPVDQSLNNLLSNDPPGLIKVTETNQMLGTGGEAETILSAPYEDSPGKTLTWTFDPAQIKDYVYVLETAEHSKKRVVQLAGIEKTPPFTISTLPKPAGIAHLFKDGALHVTWSKIKEAEGYTVLYRAKEDGPDQSIETTEPSATISLPDLREGNIYQVRVMAWNSKAISPASSIVHIKAERPSTPTKPMLQRLDQAFRVSWNATKQAASYTLTMTDLATKQATVVANLQQPVYEATSLQAGKSYSFEVQAVNIFGESEKSPAAQDTAAAAMKVASEQWFIQDRFDQTTEATRIADFGYEQRLEGEGSHTSSTNYVKFLDGDVDGNHKGAMSLFLKDSSKNVMTIVRKDLTKGTTHKPITGLFVFELEFKEAPPEDSKPVMLLSPDGLPVVCLKVDSQRGNLLYAVQEEGKETYPYHLTELEHNAWYKVRLIVNTESKTVDVYLNDKLQLTGAPFYEKQARSIQSFQGQTSKNGIKPIQYKDVKAYVAQP